MQCISCEYCGISAEKLNRIGPLVMYYRSLDWGWHIHYFVFFLISWQLFSTGLLFSLLPPNWCLWFLICWFVLKGIHWKTIPGSLNLLHFSQMQRKTTTTIQPFQMWFSVLWEIFLFLRLSLICLILCKGGFTAFGEATWRISKCHSAITIYQNVFNGEGLLSTFALFPDESTQENHWLPHGSGTLVLLRA